MSESLATLLLRLSEAGEPALLWGRHAKPYLGRGLDRLLAEGVLVERPPATEWPVCASCDCGLDVRPIEEVDGRLVAACPNDSGSDVVLDADDVRSFRIDLGRLTREIAEESGFEAELDEIVPGVWLLGSTSTGRAAFLAYSVVAGRQPGLLNVLRVSARRAPVTLLAPALPHADRKRFDDAGVYLVRLREAIGTDGTSPFALDLSRLEPEAVAGPRLVIAQSTRRVELDGVPRPLADQPFRLLCLLAERACGTPGVPAGTREIEDHVWGSSLHRVTRTARDVVRELRDGLAGAAPDSGRARGLIENRHNRGYLLALAPEEIDIRP